MDMRTTLNIDDELLARARERFPAGTPKTVIIEEALRLLASAGPASPTAASPDDPRLARLVAAGTLTMATVQAPPAPPGGGLPLADLLADLASDRADR
jgi:hypothetical protein